METRDIWNLIEEGDFVKDPMDGEIRKVSDFTIHDSINATVHFEDGGCMDIAEIKSVFLESEVA